MIKIQEWQIKDMTKIINNPKFWRDNFGDKSPNCKHTEDEALNLVVMSFIYNNRKYIKY